MRLKDWPIDDKPREKLTKLGATALSDAELIAIFLGCGIKGKNALDIARELLSNYGCLHKLLSATSEQLTTYPGIGPTKYILLQAAVELGKRYLHTNLSPGEIISSPSETKQFLLSQLRDTPHEVFACLFLSSRHRVLAFEKLFYGTIDNATVYPRELIKKVLAHNAAAVIFAHNHPSGDCLPSHADKQLTQQLKNALMQIHVKVLDHLVVGANEVLSFVEQGWL